MEQLDPGAVSPRLALAVEPVENTAQTFMPTSSRSWLAVSATEWIASESIELDPVMA